VQRFRGGLVFKAHILLYHSTLGLRVIQKKKKKDDVDAEAIPLAERARAVLEKGTPYKVAKAFT